MSLHESRIAWIAILTFGALIGIGGAMAQQAMTISKNGVERPANEQYDQGNCYDYQVKYLTMATDVDGNTYEEQEKDMLAAEAYAKLNALGQMC